MKMKKWLAVLMTLAVTTAGLAGCGASDKPAAQQESAGKTEAAETVSGETGSSEQAGGEKVRIKLFTGKIETIDVMDDIIADFNASQDRIEVEQEYQKDASNIIKIKFASGEVPDIMTTYEQGFVDEGKYLDLSGQSEWWDRLSPSMKEACTDVKTGNQYRVCTNMTMAGFFYNKEMLDEMGLEIPRQWDDFVTVLETIKKEKPDVTPWFIFGSEAWHLGHLIEFIPHGYVKSTLGTIDAKKAMLNNDQSSLRFGEPDGPMAFLHPKCWSFRIRG